MHDMLVKLYAIPGIDDALALCAARGVTVVTVGGVRAPVRGHRAPRIGRAAVKVGSRA